MGSQDPCRQAAAEGDEEEQGDDSQSQKVGAEPPKSLPPPDKDKTMYTIAVKTSNIFGAGTDANVFVQLFGQNGNSDSIPLKKSINHRNKFERNHSDVFIFNDMKNLGPIKQVKIWHDNSGFGAAWHLEKVAVHDASTNMTYVFPCNKWLSKKDDDRQLCRVLNVETTNQKMPRHFRLQREAEAKMAAEAAKKSATQAPQQNSSSSQQQAAPYPVYGSQGQMPQPYGSQTQGQAATPYPTQVSPLFPTPQLGYMPQGQITMPYPPQQATYPSAPAQGQSHNQTQSSASSQSPYPAGQQAYAMQGQPAQYPTAPQQTYGTQGTYQQPYNQQMPAYQPAFGYPQTNYGAAPTGAFINYGSGVGGYNMDPNNNPYFGQNMMLGTGAYGGQAQQQMYPYGGQQQIYGQSSSMTGSVSHHKSHKKHHRHH